MERTLSGMLERAVQLRPGGVVTIGRSGERMTYAALQQRARRVAAGLHAQGKKPGELLGICLPNGEGLFSSFYGVMHLGGLAVFLDPFHSAEHEVALLRKAGCNFVIVETAEALKRLQAVDAELEGVVVADMMVFEGEVPTPPSDPDAQAMLLSTRGNTGVPKLCPVTHMQAIRRAELYAWALKAGSREVFLASQPLFHHPLAISTLVGAVRLTGIVVMAERGDPRAALLAMGRYGVSLVHTTPHEISAWLREVKNDWRLEGVVGREPLRAGLVSGQLPIPGLLEKAEGLFGIPIYFHWSSVETGPGTLHDYETRAPKRHQAIGQPVPDSEIQIVDPESLVERAPGQTGELLVRGWNVPTSYWKDEEETVLHMIEGGWFRTGDLVTIDAQRNLYYKGRLKDLIKRKHTKVIPSVLERYILRHPKVVECAVVGTPHTLLGQSVCACCVLVQGEELRIEELRTYLKRDLPTEQLPDELLVLDAMPHLPGGEGIRRYGEEGLLEVAKNSPRQHARPERYSRRDSSRGRRGSERGGRNNDRGGRNERGRNERGGRGERAGRNERSAGNGRNDRGGRNERSGGNERGGRSERGRSDNRGAPPAASPATRDAPRAGKPADGGRGEGRRRDNRPARDDACRAPRKSHGSRRDAKPSVPARSRNGDKPS